MRQVAAAVREAGTVETITLDQSTIGGFVGAKILADTLRPPTVLSKLSVDNCKLGDEGTKALCSMLALNNVLRELSLCGNSIGKGKSGIKALAEGLKLNATVETLRLDSNNLGNYGVKCLADALRLSQTTALQSLQLSGNSVADKGAEALAQCLESNAVLRVLELWNNRITCKGALALASSIKDHNRVLEKLNVNGNRIDVSGVAELTNVLLAHRSLTFLHLEGNPGRTRQQRPTRVVIGANEDTLSLSGRSLRGSANSIKLSIGSETRKERATGTRHAPHPSDDIVLEPQENECEEEKSCHDAQVSSVGEAKPLFFFMKAGQPEPQAPSLEYIPLGDPRFGPSINTRTGHSVGDIYDIRNEVRLRIVPLFLFF